MCILELNHTQISFLSTAGYNEYIHTAVRCPRRLSLLGGAHQETDQTSLDPGMCQKVPKVRSRGHHWYPSVLISPQFRAAHAFHASQPLWPATPQPLGCPVSLRICFLLSLPRWSASLPFPGARQVKPTGWMQRRGSSCCQTWEPWGGTRWKEEMPSSKSSTSRTSTGYEHWWYQVWQHGKPILQRAPPAWLSHINPSFS